ncbi:MAG: hypothetical protein GY953_19715, partial [bacterium]|nr:hypothetical protein [bacterium]
MPDPVPKDEPADSRGEVTVLLSAVRREETSAMDRLVPLVYDELRIA